VGNPFSGVGVNGADVMFESLLGPNVVDPDFALRCDIIFPDAEVTTLGLDVTGSEEPRSRLFGKRGTLESVGVGGVFTIIGAISLEGGVRGAALVSIGWILAEAVRGRSGEELVEIGSGGGCLSGNIAPILDATLPRLLSAEFFSFSFSFSLSFCNCSSPAPPAFRSGLGVGLVPRRPGLKASFNLRPGEGDRL
jgi:hypothetical protein